MGSQKQLTQYLREVRDKPFRWGDHDCLIFSNAAFKAYHGYGYAEDWLGRYMKDGEPMLPSRLRVEYGVINFDELIEERLEPISYVPPKGAVCATKKADRWHIGYGLGISIGTKAAFLSQRGVVYFPLDDITKAWVAR
jgi:hypothetical protein